MREMFQPYRFPLSVHREDWERKQCPYVYIYDPAEDGPEVAIIKLIRASYPNLQKGN